MGRRATGCRSQAMLKDDGFQRPLRVTSHLLLGVPPLRDDIRSGFSNVHTRAINSHPPLETFLGASRCMRVSSDMSACGGKMGQGMEGSEREALLQKVSEQNSRLQQLIEAIVKLITRSRDVLRRQRSGDSQSADDGGARS